jgi:hypothetical protein
MTISTDAEPSIPSPQPEDSRVDEAAPVAVIPVVPIATKDSIAHHPGANIRRLREPAILQRAAFWSAILLIAITALVAGLVLRRWAWDQTEPIRFTMDIDNAFHQGNEAMRVGYLDRYGLTADSHDVDGNYDLDYGPARLLIATVWAHWVRVQVDGPNQDFQVPPYWGRSFYQEARSLNKTYALCRPLLILNTVGEILAAVAMFLLVRRWTSRRQRILVDPQNQIYREIPTRPVLGAVLGLVATLFFWFDPELIWNAHCWPQWDSWVLPFLLWALVAASADWWLTAGAIIAVGAMFKGQILFGAPFFLLWPLFRGNLLGALRWIIGLACGTAASTAVWLVRTDQHVNGSAVAWLICIAVIAAALPFLMKLPGAWYVKLIPVPVVVGLFIWPFPKMGWIWILSAVLGLAAMAVLVWALPRRALKYTIAAWIATAFLLCIPIFNGGTGWFQVGIAYGTRHYMHMGSGPNDNLAEILSTRYHWDDPMDAAYTLPANTPKDPHPSTDWIGSALAAVDRRVDFQPGQSFDIPLKYVLVTAWLLCLTMSSAGAAIHSARQSPRFLISIAAPWIVFFAVMTQMHQRYLIWGAALSAASVVVSPGFALLHILVSIIAVSQEFQTMMEVHGQSNAIYEFVNSWHPGVGWALLLIAAIYTYVGLVPERRRNKLIPQPRTEVFEEPVPARPA